jgi:hypothetical protein
MAVDTISYSMSVNECPKCQSKKVTCDQISYGRSYQVTTDDFYCEDCGCHWHHEFLFSRQIVREWQEGE